MLQADIDFIWTILGEIPDPEIPAVSLVDMGIVRAVEARAEGQVIVKITPTFSGCPALHVMKSDIIERLQQAGNAQVEVQTVYSPPWTTDWISEQGRMKLREFGIAPPARHGGSFEVILLEAAICPYCDSGRTTLCNSFGSTLCRMIYFCNNCQQPFEQFKPL